MNVDDDEQHEEAYINAQVLSSVLEIESYCVLIVKYKEYVDNYLRILRREGLSIFSVFNAGQARVIEQWLLSTYYSRIMFSLSIMILFMFITLFLEFEFSGTLWYHRLSSEVEGFLICPERVNGQDVA
ncbi:hypothetical protein AVEN_63299-1 [Araneus ventricosus]|uniref:Uncharacterized protein n=1 Tax=Araneus ventricosus TaxID=182803 RepID=A0A4Y2FKK8_ARAVE|nr:hypothetical protein AVEN_63299-1 [Araneus ventricosus]